VVLDQSQGAHACARHALADAVAAQQRAAHPSEGRRLAPGEDARIVVAAVDVGILNLTNYKPPAPDDYYLGQRRLTADIRDLYGQLIDGMQVRRGQIRTGGDAGGRAAGLAAHAEAARALFRYCHSQARLAPPRSFRHPGFCRHRAGDGVAWSKDKGRPRRRRCHHPRPGGLTATLPRFLLNGDRGTMHLDLDNVAGQPAITGSR
jgi:uncharacterized protein YfaS (alpha-2-macroglobulin family)